MVYRFISPQSRPSIYLRLGRTFVGAKPVVACVAPLNGRVPEDVILFRNGRADSPVTSRKNKSFQIGDYVAWDGRVGRIARLKQHRAAFVRVIGADRNPTGEEVELRVGELEFRPLPYRAPRAQRRALGNQARA